MSPLLAALAIQSTHLGKKGSVSPVCHSLQFLKPHEIVLFLSTSKQLRSSSCLNHVFAEILGESNTDFPRTYVQNFFREIQLIERLLGRSKFFRSHCSAYCSFTAALMHLPSTPSVIIRLFFSIQRWNDDWLKYERPLTIWAKYLIHSLKKEQLERSFRSMVQTNLSVSVAAGIHIFVRLFFLCGAHITGIARIRIGDEMVVAYNVKLAVRIQRLFPHKNPIPLVKLLKECGADIRSCRYPLREGPLHWAAQDGNSSLCHFLLQQKAPVNAKNRHGEFPLLKAIRHHHFNVVSLLLQQSKIDVDACIFDGRTPLMEACSQGLHDIVFTLLNRKANPMCADIKLQTPLHHTASSKVKDGYLSQIFARLLKSGDIDIQDNNGSTPLMLCARHNPKMVPYVTSWGADLHARDKMGNTPLHYAESRESVFLLIQAKANIFARNLLKETPLQHFKKQKHKEAADELVTLLVPPL